MYMAAAQAGSQVLGGAISMQFARKTAEANKAALSQQKIEMMMDQILAEEDERQRLTEFTASAQAQVAASGVELSGSIFDRVVQASVDSAKAVSRQRLNLDRKKNQIESLIKQQSKQVQAQAISTLFGAGQAGMNLASTGISRRQVDYTPLGNMSGQKGSS